MTAVRFDIWTVFEMLTMYRQHRRRHELVRVSQNVMEGRGEGRLAMASTIVPLHNRHSARPSFTLHFPIEVNNRQQHAILLHRKTNHCMYKKDAVSIKKKPHPHYPDYTYQLSLEQHSRHKYHGTSSSRSICTCIIPSNDFSLISFLTPLNQPTLKD